jgi:acetyl-CoA carboxylase biotin carboxylase subunit
LKIQKLLIANRGEIAVRIIRACRELGLTSVAVFSDIDRTAPHTLMADEAYPIGPAPALESYLCIDKIISVAKAHGIHAVHPGYGFLAENADFAQTCADNNLIFVGPPPDAIRKMGAKTEARRMMTSEGVPVVPGCDNITSPENGLVEADKIGYPVMIKASFGGGGKGMRIVQDEGSLVSFLESASREAKSAFGDGSVYLEKYLKNPRHIEIQILSDNYGNVIYLGERECSVQRRHQKVIEESPSPAINEELRRRMGEAAVKAARICGYRNAGTVEFMFSEGKFYFLEMNTRLQVEHPVTEMITGLDLVKEQIFIAIGEPLRFRQSDILRRGHAIESRIYSEDENFLPVTGGITEYMVPQGPGVRVDGGVQSGSTISRHYDPLIAKLIVWGEDRPTAINRMKRALQEYRITGLKTTIPFCLAVMNDPDFIRGEYHTGFVGEKQLQGTAIIPEEVLKAAVLAISSNYVASQTAFIASNQENQDGGFIKRSNWKFKGRLENLR